MSSLNKSEISAQSHSANYPEREIDLTRIDTTITLSNAYESSEAVELYAEFSRSPWYERVNRSLIDMLPLAPDHRAIDVGCGSGNGTRLVAEFLSAGGHVLGLDSSAAQIEAARARSAPGLPLSFGLADGYDLSAAIGAPVNGIICFNSLHHFSDKERFFRSAASCLQPGGYLGFCTGYVKHRPTLRDEAALEIFMNAIVRTRSEFPESMPIDAPMSQIFEVRSPMISLERLPEQFKAAGFTPPELFIQDLELTATEFIELISTPYTSAEIFPRGVPLSARRRIIAEEVISSGIHSFTRRWAFGIARFEP